MKPATTYTVLRGLEGAQQPLQWVHALLRAAWQVGCVLPWAVGCWGWLLGGRAHRGTIAVCFVRGIHWLVLRVVFFFPQTSVWFWGIVRAGGSGAGPEQGSAAALVLSNALPHLNAVSQRVRFRDVSA